MRTVLGAFLLTMSCYAAFGVVFLTGWSANELAVVSGAAAFVLLLAGGSLLWRPQRRWLVILPSMGLGFALMVVAVLTTKCGMTAQNNVSQELFVQALGYELHKEVGTEDAIRPKMLQWGLLVTGAYVAVGAAVGAMLGAAIRCRKA